MISAAHHQPATDLAHAFSRSIVGFFPMLLVLALAHWFGPLLTHELPQSLSGLRVWGPAMVLFLSITLALTFNRGRMVFASLSLAGAYFMYQLQLVHVDAFALRTVFAAMCIFVPLNLATLSLLHERGVFTLYGARRAFAIALQVALTAWIVIAERTAVVDGVYDLVHSLPLPSSPIPPVALLLMVLAAMVTAFRALRTRSALDVGLTGALAAFALACHSVGKPALFSMYVGAAAGVLAVAVLQDTFRLAFRDELTGLPSRRALNERMLALGHHYAIAMVDVDHFKRFNDTHGHELGDHVLRMVAAKLERVGAGRAYRFGGEEFAIVFPGKHMREVWPHLEALREQISAHHLTLRAPERDPAKQGRPGERPPVSVGVTVSIGLAERGERLTTPADVLVAADGALYRAKHKGRNRISL
ncbi:MAG: GGDEF domain-containing protein [Burkholderiales bacterium]|nr:GGDEF domain-containing protein [Burkholderiales bacterium]